VLASDNTEFLQDFLPFQHHIARIGMFNSLSQTLIKLTSPGVPDIYQGQELWDFSLVDPDNRRPVDYDHRQKELKELQIWGTQTGDKSKIKDRVKKLTDNMSDGRIKLYLTLKALQLRKTNPVVFQEGTFTPLAIHGIKAKHLVAYARSHEKSTVLVIVPRLCAQLLWEGTKSPSDPAIWGDTRVELSAELDGMEFKNQFTVEDVHVERASDRSTLQVSSLLAEFPVALLATNPKL
jgi:(1->4)-alpha-D-glucan 1-alpha-D-glucosylmutase